VICKFKVCPFMGEANMPVNGHTTVVAQFIRRFMPMNRRATRISKQPVNRQITGEG